MKERKGRKGEGKGEKKRDGVKGRGRREGEKRRGKRKIVGKECQMT